VLQQRDGRAPDVRIVFDQQHPAAGEVLGAGNARGSAAARSQARSVATRARFAGVA
jgi:hypothetical protein